MSARCFIDGQEVELARIAKRVMNFGQAVAEQPALGYELRVERSAFEQRLRSAHAQTLDELRADAGDEDETTAGLRALQWPDLDALIAQDFALFRTYLCMFLVTEALDAFALAPVSSAAYQLDSLDDVAVDGTTLSLSGRCYAAGTSSPV